MADSTINSKNPYQIGPVSEPDTTEQSRRSHRENVTKLSRRGLVLMLVAMSIFPVATVLTLWYYLPPVSVYTLEADVRVTGLETATSFDRRNPDPAVPEPLVHIQNTGKERWTHLIVEINKRYKMAVTDQPVEPGDTISLGLDYFQTREGLLFAPGKIPLRHVRVYARLPSRSRATHEREF